MGVMADRALKFVIAASIALVLMSLQTWQRSDWYGSIHGTDVDGLTGIGDGVLVLLGAAAAGLLALLSLVHPVSRRPAGVAIGLLGAAMLAVALHDILYLPALPDVLFFPRPGGDGHYYATPLLYFAAATSFLVGLAGLTMASARPYRTSREPVDEEVTAWA